MNDLTQSAMLSLAHKLHSKRDSLLQHGIHDDLFDGTNQNLIATLKRPTSIKEWNDFTSLCLSAEANLLIDSEEERYRQRQHELIRNRRIKGRGINGTAEMYVKIPEEEYPAKERIIEIVDEIENSELAVIELQRMDEQRRSQVVDATRRK